MDTKKTSSSDRGMKPQRFVSPEYLNRRLVRWYSVPKLAPWRPQLEEWPNEEAMPLWAPGRVRH